MRTPIFYADNEITSGSGVKVNLQALWATQRKTAVNVLLHVSARARAYMCVRVINSHRDPKPALMYSSLFRRGGICKSSSLFHLCVNA